MRIAEQVLALNHKSDDPVALSPDELAEVRGSANQYQTDELLGLSMPVPRDSPVYGEWSNGRQLAIDGANMTAQGMGRRPEAC